jgi:malonyl CoA-acyl carrier protein transacylase
MVDTGALSLDMILAPQYPDGSALLTDTGIAADTLAPRTVADLVARLAARDAASDTGGAIDVTLVTAPDGTRRAIVDIPGTKTWTPWFTKDVTSLSTNARALVGVPTTYAAGVLLALRRAGVRADEPVLLAGHSQGGMVAVEVAAMARQTGEFDVTHVVTAGSPIGRTVGTLPSSVDVLALENSTDVVPHLDAADNPDRRNVTTVTFRAGDRTIVGDHALDPSYEFGARLVDDSCETSLRDFEESLSGFLGGGSAVTHTYTVSRRP